jgi:hypothetical protein
MARLWHKLIPYKDILLFYLWSKADFDPLLLSYVQHVVYL